MLSYQLLLIPNADPISCQQLGQSDNGRGRSRNGGRDEIDITTTMIALTTDVHGFYLSRRSTMQGM